MWMASTDSYVQGYRDFGTSLSWHAMRKWPGCVMLSESEASTSARLTNWMPLRKWPGRVMLSAAKHPRRPDSAIGHLGCFALAQHDTSRRRFSCHLSFSEEG